MTEAVDREVSSDHAYRADTTDHHVLAGVGLRADEPVHRPGRHPARPRPHHRVRRRKLVGGQARPVRVHRGTRRPGRTGRGRGRRGRRSVLDRLHRRDGAGVPQADRSNSSASFIQPTYQALIDGAKYCEPRLREIIAKHRPDVIVEDNVVLFPALVTSGAPFVRIVSCSPLEVTGPGVPPPFSGLPSADRSQWDAYRAEFDRTHRAMWSDFNDWVQAQGADPLPELEFMPHDDGGQPVRLSGRGRLPRRPPARRQLDPDGLQRARDRRGIRSCPPRSPTGPTTARSSTSRWVRSAAPTSN